MYRTVALFLDGAVRVADWELANPEGLKQDARCERDDGDSVFRGRDQTICVGVEAAAMGRAKCCKLRCGGPIRNVGSNVKCVAL